MSDAPDRVWLAPDGTFVTVIPTKYNFTEYIRADIHEARIAKQEEELETLEVYLEEALKRLDVCETYARENARLRKELYELGARLNDQGASIMAKHWRPDDE